MTCVCEDVTCVCEDVTCVCEDVTCVCEDVTCVSNHFLTAQPSDPHIDNREWTGSP